MGKYTDFLMDKSYAISDEEDYMEELKKAAKLFRSFGQALDTFLAEQGYLGDLGDVDGKVLFFVRQFGQAGIGVPRNMKRWFTEHRRIERRTAFLICFAFRLSVDEVDDFLRRICLLRGIDCHNMEEAVYFYAFKNDLDYGRARGILDRVPPVKARKLDTENVVYTKLLMEEIDRIGSEEELVSYLTQNAGSFGYNNAAAYTAIKAVWEQLASPQGLAIRERRKLYAGFDREEPGVGEPRGRKERRRPEDSIWEIYLQILGLAGSQAAPFYKNRSIKPILKENPFLHPFAEESFPDRDGLTKILNGEHVSYERVRKIMILLVFYRFWAGRALRENSYSAGYGDAKRCLASMDDFLTGAGYPALYPGNPYDFIFLFAIQAETPLLTFRDFMRELYFAAEA